MKATKIEKIVRKQIVEDLFFGDESTAIDADADLFTLGLDSLGVNRLVVFLERRFGVRIADTEIVRDNFQSIHALVQLVQKHE